MELEDDDIETVCHLVEAQRHLMKRQKRLKTLIDMEVQGWIDALMLPWTMRPMNILEEADCKSRIIAARGPPGTGKTTIVHQAL
eukprot:2431499-Amphidinium_carterae.1